MYTKRITEAHAGWVSRTLTQSGKRPPGLLVESGFGGVLVNCTYHQMGAVSKLLSQLNYEFSQRTDLGATFLIHSRVMPGKQSAYRG